VSLAVQQDRNHLLRKYARKVEQLIADRPETTCSCSLAIGRGSLKITPWEWNAIGQKLSSGEKTQVWTSMLVEALAIQMKMLADVERRRMDDPSSIAYDSDQALSDLVADVALGRVVLDELAVAIEQMRQANKQDRAEKMARFRHRMSQAVETAAETLTPEESRLADGMMEEFQRVPGDSVALAGLTTAMTGQISETLAKSLQSHDSPRTTSTERAPAHSADPRSATAKRTSPRTKNLLQLGGVGLLTFAIVFVALVVVPALNKTEIPTFDLRHFASISEVQRVIARPPNLYVRIPAQAWQDMSKARRQEVMDTIVDAIAGAGYTGAHVNGTNGRPLARWTSQQGFIFY